MNEPFGFMEWQGRYEGSQVIPSMERIPINAKKPFLFMGKERILQLEEDTC